MLENICDNAIGQTFGHPPSNDDNLSSSPQHFGKGLDKLCSNPLSEEWTTSSSIERNDNTSQEGPVLCIIDFNTLREVNTGLALMNQNEITVNSNLIGSTENKDNLVDGQIFEAFLEYNPEVWAELDKVSPEVSRDTSPSNSTASYSSEGEMNSEQAYMPTHQTSNKGGDFDTSSFYNKQDFTSIQLEAPKNSTISSSTEGQVNLDDLVDAELSTITNSQTNQSDTPAPIQYDDDTEAINAIFNNYLPTTDEQIMPDFENLFHFRCESVVVHTQIRVSLKLANVLPLSKCHERISSIFVSGIYQLTFNCKRATRV